MEMKPIKFKAYVPGINVLLNVINMDLDFNGDVTGIVVPTREITGEDTFETTFFKHEDDFKLMEYTGLHDHNGNEIYSGYIVKYPDGSVGEVVWSGGYAAYIAKLKRMKPFVFWIDDKCKVIGNVYHNKELLDKAQEA